MHKVGQLINKVVEEYKLFFFFLSTNRSSANHMAATSICQGDLLNWEGKAHETLEVVSVKSETQF